MSSAKLVESESDQKGKGSDNIHRFGFRFRPIAVALNLSFVLLFSLLHVWPLVASYVAGIFLSAWLAHQAKEHPDKAVGGLNWMWLIVLLQSMFAVIIIGVNAGFQFYAITTLPMIFANERWSLSAKILQSAVIALFLILCVTYFAYCKPVYILAPFQIELWYAFNAIGICTMLAALSYKIYLTLKETELKLYKLANTDTLTELLNRRSVIELADKEYARCRRTAQPLSVIICDIDYFKKINDNYGHDAGDRVLQAISVILRCIREYDSIARWGGEEFMILLPNTNGQNAMKIAERICLAVAQKPIFIGSDSIVVTMTLGVAQLREGENWQSTLARADAALYRGKEAGRNRFELA